MMFQNRQQMVSSVARPFANLVPPMLAATTLAFIKEVDLLATKKGEIKAKAKSGAAAEDKTEEEGGAAQRESHASLESQRKKRLKTWPMEPGYA